MKTSLHFTFFVFVVFFSCKQGEEQTYIPSQILKTEFQELLDSLHLNGNILVQDHKENSYLNSQESCEKLFLPASTFKITNSLIGLETGTIDSSTVFKWDGEDRSMDIWEKDLTLKQAFSRSCVPCYQELAREMGVDSMKKYTDLFYTGQLDFDSLTIDNFWLIGNSRINSIQQIELLKNLWNEKLPISISSQRLMKEVMYIENFGKAGLYGKTGWAVQDENVGWFIGVLEDENKQETHFISVNIQPKPSFDMANFPRIRKSIAIEAFRILGIIDV